MAPQKRQEPGTSGAHPLGAGLGATGGAVAGGAIGSIFGPVGMLVGSAVGAIGGAATGYAVAERIDPSIESEYWRNTYTTRPYYSSSYDFDTDYAPAFSYGSEARARFGDRRWDDTLENDLRLGWENAKARSHLSWEQAKDAVRDAWDRDDRTYRTYGAADRYYGERFTLTNPQYNFDTDYRPAYRYGTFARSQYPGREWDDSLERDLEREWQSMKGSSRLSWNEARSAVKDAWHGIENVMPGDVDRDTH